MASLKLLTLFDYILSLLALSFLCYYLLYISLLDVGRELVHIIEIDLSHLIGLMLKLYLHATNDQLTASMIGSNESMSTRI